MSKIIAVLFTNRNSTAVFYSVMEGSMLSYSIPANDLRIASKIILAP